MKYRTPTTPIASLPQFEEPYGDRVRFIFENPSEIRGPILAFGVQEEFARRRCRYIQIEPTFIDQGTGESVREVMELFFYRTNLFCKNLGAGTCAYWMVARVHVHREDRDTTMMPVMVCSVLAPARTISVSFESILDTPDSAEASQMARYGAVTTEILPVVRASSAEQQRAAQLMETIQRGLTAGYAIAERGDDYGCGAPH